MLYQKNVTNKVSDFAVLGAEVSGDIGKNLKLLSQWVRSEEIQFAFRKIPSGGWDVFMQLTPNEESKKHILPGNFVLGDIDEIFDRISSSSVKQLKTCNHLVTILEQLCGQLLNAVTSFASPELNATIGNLTVANCLCFFDYCHNFSPKKRANLLFF